MVSDQQLQLDDAAIAAAEGLDQALAALSDQARTDFRRILGTWVRSGEVFTTDDMREQLDLAQIRTASRGALMKNSATAGVIRYVGDRRSTHPATHGKKVACWVGTDAGRVIL